MLIRRALSIGIVPAALVTVVLVGVAQAPAVDKAPAQVLATQITNYFDGRQGAMALNFDTELYLCGMIHSVNGYDPASAASRSQDTRVGWPNILQDAATYGIPVSFNICGHEAVFGDTGRNEISAIDLFYTWHSDSHWATNTWYSDKPLNGGNYLTIGDLSGTTTSYGLVYGGDLTEQTLNSSVPHEISYHNFGHESLSDITAAEMEDTFRLGVEYHKRIGSKIRAEAPPWNNNPQTEKYPIYVQNHFFVFNAMESASSTPYEAIDNLWVIPRADAFTASTDMTSLIDGAIANGVVLANYSHPEDGFQSTSRGGFQTSLAHAKAKVDSGELWATTLSEIGRYWEAKSDASVVSQAAGGKTVVDVTLTGYDATTFGIPYLTFTSSMPDGSAYAKITVDFPTARTLNSNSTTVRVAGGVVTYTIYLNPAGTTHVEIEGVGTAFTGGVDINKPVLSIVSTPPTSALLGTPLTIQASTQSTDAVYAVNLISQRNNDAKESSIMTLNAGTWESTIGPFNAGDVIHYYVSVTDNSGRREISAPQQFTVLAGPDVDPPQWRGQGQSNANPTFGSQVTLYAQGMDTVALNTAVLATNETGTWERTSAYGSPMNLGDVSNAWVTSSFTWQNPAIPVNTTVSWRIYYEDRTGNERATDDMSFTIQAPPPGDTQPPQFFDPSVDSIGAGQPAQFSLRWTDNVSLDGYVFSFDNGTGSFVDDPYAGFSERVSGSPWWDAAWRYRKDVVVDNTAGPSALTNHAVLVIVDTAALIAAGKMNAGGGDIRFVDGAQELNYWIESGLNTPATRLWVKVPSIPAGTTKTISMYYGNPSRTVPQSDGVKTFPIFDSFGGRGWEEFKYGQAPIMGPGSSAGGSGTFSSVLRESPTLWRMYSSYDNDNSDIGMSTSTDGLHWTHQGVVLRKGAAGAWDSSNLWCPAVWKDGATYYMLYPATGPGGIRMGLATSPDGVTFTKYAGNPVFNDPNWASGDTEAACFSVLKDNGTYYVMYNTLNAHRQASIAYSIDLINWSPAYSYPRFPGGSSPSDWNYHTFCGNVFKYEDSFYLILPGQDDSHDYAKFGLYTSHSPLFPESDTEFKGIVFTGTPGSWDAGDMDTPWTVQFDGKMHMYYAACGSCWSQTGVAVIDDIPRALTEAYVPGNYINVTRAATASQMIMPPAGWQKSIAGYQEVGGQNFEIVLSPAVTGRAVRLHDANAAQPLELYRDIATRTRGSVSAWLRIDNNHSGDFDLDLYGDSHSALAAAVGLGANGTFHYWNGASIDTALSYQPNTWYLVQASFDAGTDTYTFEVYDTAFTQLLQLDGIPFGTPVAAGIDRITLRTSASFNGDAHLDDVVVRELAAVTPGVVTGTETTQVFPDAWARTTKSLNSSPGMTIRWKYTAWDTSGNSTTSDVYSFVTEAPDNPPSLTLVAPADNAFASSASIDFKAICSDERDIATVALLADWSGVWGQVDAVSGPGRNGTEVTFSKTVPDGVWTWSVRCDDSTGHSTWGVVRNLTVESHPAPWWHCAFTDRRRLTVHENSGHALNNYPVYAVVDTASLIAAGKMRADCNDVRVVNNGTEIPSQVMDCGAATSKIWFETDLLASEARRAFYLYYGNPSAIAPDYGGQVGISWNGGTSTMNSGKITASFIPAGGIIGQVKNNSNNQDLLYSGVERGLGYLFSNNPAVYYIFKADETDDSIALTTNGPVVKVVTATSGEVPPWTQQYVFYNNQDFIDFKAFRPTGSTDRFLVGANLITPDGTFSPAETNELLRVDNSASDISVTFDDAWKFNPTGNRGYVGLVDPTSSNQMAFVWDQTFTQDFTWKARTEGGSYSLFIGGNGISGNYGTINADAFDYRVALQQAASPSNAATQPIYEYYVAHPTTVTFGPEEQPTPQSDTIPPEVTITSPTHSTYKTATIALSYTTSEAVVACSYSLDGGPSTSLPGCGGTTLTGLANGWHELQVSTTDCAGNPGSSSVIFQVYLNAAPSGWWDTSWHYRVPVTINTGSYSRKNDPVEFSANFTQVWSLLGESGLSLDPNSIRVLEYTSSGALIGEVPSQFDRAAGYNPATNASGTVDWIMSGTTAAQTSRYYDIYFDSTTYPKTAPSYPTDLAWNTTSHVLTNAYFNATLGSSTSPRQGVNSLNYSSITYTSGDPGIYYVTGSSNGASYASVIDGPVKKTIKLTPNTNGFVSFTMYSQGEVIRADGNLTGSAFSFTGFPYAQNLSSSALSTSFHYYKNGAVVNETLGGQGWLGSKPDEGWACLDGIGSNKGLCFVTNNSTLSATNNFWRYGSGLQVMLPTWNPNPTFPVQPVSWLVMAGTTPNRYQDGRDFWNKLGAPIGATQGAAEKLQPPQAPVVDDIPDQTITQGGSFAAIQLDSHVTDLDNASSTMLWTYSGNVHLAVNININRVATVTVLDPTWTGSETIAFTATDPDSQSDSDTATFTVIPACTAEICNGLDDDCNGVVDDGLGLTTCGVGSCQRTVANCVGGVPQTCAPGTPGTEICNGLDDDCDGVVDDGDPGAGAACATGQPGVCAAGTMHCVGGALVCQPITPSSPEVCDGRDNDCNGLVDDGITATMAIPSNLVGIPGQTIVVPVQLGDVAGRGVYAGEMDVRFDPTVLSALSVAQGAALTGKNCTLTENLSTPDRILVDLFCTMPLTGNTPLVNVSFQVANVLYGRSTALTFAKAQLNEGCPSVTAAAGLFTVRGPEVCDGQDNDGVGGIDEICTVSGRVLYYRNDVPPGEPSDKPVPNVGIAVSGTMPSQTMTDGNGTYLIGGLQGSVSVSPLHKSGDRNGAISSLDAAAVAMAAVGNGSLTANQFIAGDVTGNRTISALDASYIARLSVGLVTEFPVATTTGSDWMFLKCVPDYAGTCGDPTYTIDPITGPQTGNDFYAILYGDVTGNWPQAGTFASSRTAISPEENDAVVRDLELADRFRNEGPPPVIERRPGSAPAELSLSGWKPLRAGEQTRLSVNLLNADGILGLDLVLRYDPSRIAIISTQTTGIGSNLSVATRYGYDTLRVAAYGNAALSGSGVVLAFTVEGRKNTGRQAPPTIDGVANEGGIPLLVRERDLTPPKRR